IASIADGDQETHNGCNGIHCHRPIRLPRPHSLVHGKPSAPMVIGRAWRSFLVASRPGRSYETAGPPLRCFARSKNSGSLRVAYNPPYAYDERQQFCEWFGALACEESREPITLGA